MGDILQIRLICATPDPEAARARWPQLCRLARELYDRNRVMDSGQGLFLPHWDENQPMPGVRELARTLQQAALIFHKSIYNLPEDALRELSHTADALGDALGNWRTAEARDALKTLLRELDELEAALRKQPQPPSPGPAPAVIEAAAVTWNPALLEKLCPRLCEALHDADKKKNPDAAPPQPDALRLLDFLRQAPWEPEIRERLKAPLARAEACRAALDKALRDGDPRAANRHSNDMDEILEQLETAVSYRPAGRKGFFRRLFG